MSFEKFEERPSWMSKWNKFNSYESPCLPNASHQVSAESNLAFKNRPCFKISKQATMAAILNIGMEPKLAILNLHVTPMPPSKVELNWTYHSGADMVWRFSKWPPLELSWISERNDFSKCCSDASHQVSAQSNLQFGRSCFKIFKMADMVVKTIGGVAHT